MVGALELYPAIVLPATVLPPMDDRVDVSGGFAGERGGIVMMARSGALVSGVSGRQLVDSPLVSRR